MARQAAPALTQFPSFARSVLGASLCVLAWGCGGAGGHVVKDSGPVVAEKPPEAPKVPDAFADHTGPKARAGEKFRLAAKPVAVQGPDLVIELDKVDWQTLTSPSGKEIREATVNMVLYRGQDRRKVMIGQRDEKVAMGARIQVLDAGEDYNRQRLVYEPWVLLLVEAAAE